MLVRILTLALAFAFSATFGCAASPAKDSNVSATARSATSASPIFFWRATHPEVKAEIYLYGSMHMRRAEHASIPPEVEEVAARADVTLFELAEGEEDSPALQMETLSRGLLDGETLDEVVAPDTYAAVKIAAARAGTPMMIIDRMRPWLAAMTLEVSGAVKSELKLEHGVEVVLRERLSRRAIAPESAGLETGSEQLDVFASLSDEQAEGVLRAVANASDTGSADLEALELAYANGNLAHVTRLVQESEQDPALKTLHANMLSKRNHRMVKRLLPYADRSAVVLVTVGCAHFVGDSNILTLLADAGFTLVRMGPDSGGAQVQRPPRQDAEWRRTAVVLLSGAS